jgi:hypothetical protein
MPTGFAARSPRTPPSARPGDRHDGGSVTRLAREFASAQPAWRWRRHRLAAPRRRRALRAVNILNYVAGNIGQTVHFGARLGPRRRARRIAALQAAMDAGPGPGPHHHEANPVYALPKASKFAESLAKVPFKVSTSPFYDETSALCDLLLPNHHALERWDDVTPAPAYARWCSR